ETEVIVKGTLSAGRDAVVQSRTKLEGDAIAYSQGGGLGVDADATASINVLDTSQTTTEIWGTARIQADRIQVSAILDGARMDAKADSLADAFGADSDGTASINLKGTVLVQLQTR